MEHIVLVSELPKTTRKEVEELLVKHYASKSVLGYFGIGVSELGTHCVRRHRAKPFFGPEWARATIEMIEERGTSVKELAWAMINAHIGHCVYESGLFPRDVTEKMMQEVGLMAGRK